MFRKILIVLAVSCFCFFIGGGWHFFTPSDQFIYGLFYRLDTDEAEKFAWVMLLLFCGPVASLAGALVTVLVLAIRAKRKTN